MSIFIWLYEWYFWNFNFNKINKNLNFNEAVNYERKYKGKLQSLYLRLSQHA